MSGIQNANDEFDVLIGNLYAISTQQKVKKELKKLGKDIKSLAVYLEQSCRN